MVEIEQKFYRRYKKTLSKNQLKILNLLSTGKKSREEINLYLLIPISTVYDILDILWNWGFVELKRIKEKNGKPGAPKTFWFLSDGKNIDFTGRTRLKQSVIPQRTFSKLKTFF